MIYHGVGIGGGLIGFIAMLETLKEQYEVEILSIFDSEAVGYIKKYHSNVSVSNNYFYGKIYGLLLSSEAEHYSLGAHIRGCKNFVTFLLSKYFFAKNALKKLNNKHELVYLNSMFISDWAYAAKKIGSKTLMHVREPFSSANINLISGRCIRKTIIQSCDGIIAVSKDNLLRLNLENVYSKVIYDQVIQRKVDEKKPSLDLNFKYFIYPGGDAKMKGYETIIKALPFLNSDIKIIFAGAYRHQKRSRFKKIIQYFVNPYEAKRVDLIKKMSLAENAVCIGTVDNINDYYALSLATICPFSAPHAALPVLESYSIGVPVITSNVEGMYEINSGEAGWIFHKNNYLDLASKINLVSMMSKKSWKNKSASAILEYAKYKTENATILNFVQNVVNPTK